MVSPPLARKRRDSRGVAATRISIVCVALGAILYFAVSRAVGGLVVAAIGVTLMIVGGVGLVASDLVLAKVRRVRAGKPFAD